MITTYQFFLEKKVPEKQNSSFEERGDGDGPPHASYTDAGTQKESERNAKRIEEYADDSRWSCLPQAIEHTLRSDFQHHEELRKTKNQQILTSGNVGLSFRDKH